MFRTVDFVTGEPMVQAAILARFICGDHSLFGGVVQQNRDQHLRLQVFHYHLLGPAGPVFHQRQHLVLVGIASEHRLVLVYADDDVSSTSTAPLPELKSTAPSSRMASRIRWDMNHTD